MNIKKVIHDVHCSVPSNLTDITPTCLINYFISCPVFHTALYIFAFSAIYITNFIISVNTTICKVKGAGMDRP